MSDKEIKSKKEIFVTIANCESVENRQEYIEEFNLEVFIDIRDALKEISAKMKDNRIKYK